MTNNAPTAPSAPIPVAVINPGQAWSYVFPTFTDPDNGDMLTYTATLGDGTALPGWLTFNADNRTFTIASGAASVVGRYDLKITATDDGSPAMSTDVTFSLIIVGEDSVVLDSDGIGTDHTDGMRNGTVMIADSDEIASVEASGRFGSVTITEDSANSGHYDWVYTLNEMGDADLTHLHGQSIVETITITATYMDGTTATQHVLIDVIGTGGNAVDDASRTDTAPFGDGGGKSATLIHGVQFKVVGDLFSTGNKIFIDVITRDADDNPFQANAIIRDDEGYDFQFTPDALITPEILKATWDNAHRADNRDDEAEQRVGRIASEIIDANLEGVPVQHVLGRYWFTGGAAPILHYDSEDKAVTLDWGAADVAANDALTATGRVLILLPHGEQIASFVDSIGASGARYGDVVLAKGKEGTNDWIWTYTLNPQDADTNALAADTHEVITITVTDPDGQISTHDMALDITVTGTPPTPTLAPARVALGAAWTPDAITAFADADGAATYAATLANGDALPTWLTFDETARTFAITAGETTANDVGRYEVRVTATRGGEAVDSATFYLTVGDIAASFEDIPADDAKPIIEIHGVRFTIDMPTAAGATAGYLNIRAGDAADKISLIDDRYYEILLQENNYTPEALDTLWEDNTTSDKDDRVARISTEIVNASLGEVAKEELYGTYYFAPDLGDRSVAFNHDDNSMHDTEASGTLAISDVNGGVASYRAQATYGTIRIIEDSTTPGHYNWAYMLSTDSRSLQALEAGRTEDTITFIVTDGDGHTATHDVAIDLDIIKEPPPEPPTDDAAEFMELDGDGIRTATLHGVTFREVSVNSAGERDIIRFFRNDSAHEVDLTTRDMEPKYRIVWSWGRSENVDSDDLAALWNGDSDTQGKITATATQMLTDTATRLHNMKSTLTGVPPRDDAVEIDHTDNTSDPSASATLTITDANGLMASNITASAGTYGVFTGTFTLAAGSTTSGDYRWTYTLNPNDPQTAALTAGPYTETITITVVDNDGFTATYDETITITIAGQGDWLGATTSIRRTVNTDPAVTLNYGGTNTLEATGTLTITDTDGVASVTHNGDTATQYGVFAFDVTTGAWTYTLNPNDPDTAALAAGTVQETIAFTVTDGATTSTETTHDLVIDVNVMGTATWLNSDNTNFRETPEDSSVTLNYTTGEDSLETTGTLTITDRNGIDSISHTEAEYGTFTFDEATGAWKYTLDFTDPDTAALTAAQGGTETITFTVTDETAGGGVMMTHPLEITINVVGANAKPTANPLTGITVDEDATFDRFTGGHFGFTDTDEGDVLESLTITGLPTAGALTFKGAAVKAGLVIDPPLIPDLVYTPGDSFAANGTATFTYRVNDGRINSDEATLTINVEAEDDIATDMTLTPTAAADTLSANTDTTAAIKVADITFMGDPDDASPGTPQVVGANAAVFEVVKNAAGGFDLQVKAGATLTAGPLVVTIQLAENVSVSKDLPLTINAVPTATPVNPDPISEDPAANNHTHPFTADNFGFTDTDSGDELKSITITGLPVSGTPATPTGMLTLDGVAVAAGDVIDVDRITAGDLVYTPGDTLAANADVTFTYTVSDGKTSSEEATLTITVVADDDPATEIALGAPVATLAADADTASGIQLADITLNDPDGGNGGTPELLGSKAALDLLDVADDGDGGFDLRIKAGVTLTEGTFTVTIRLMEAPSVSVGYSLIITPPNAAPTATPATGLIVTKDATYIFDAGNFGFADTDMGDALVSVTIVDLPNAGTLALDGVAVAPSDEIAVARITAGDLVYTPPSGLANDADVTFTYTVSDGKASSDTATMSIKVEAVNDAPTLVVTDDDIIFDSGVFVLTREHLNATDIDTPPRGLTYTLTAFDFSGDANATFEVYDTTTETWTTLMVGTSGSDTFTQAQVDNGHVRLNAASGNGTLVVTLSDVANMTAAATITVTIRVVETPSATKIGGAGGDEGLNYNNNTDMPEENAKARSVTTGIGDTKITLGSGNDKVDAGLGDDEIDLGAGGDDIVIYRFGTDAETGNTIAWSGGDSITGFTPGQDALVLSHIDGDDGGDAGVASFLNGLGTGFIATVSTAYTGGAGGDRASLDNYSITGVEIHFAQAVVLPGGVLGGSILSITFANPIAWADAGTPGGNDHAPGFNSEWLNGAAGPEDDADAPFNIDDLTFNDNVAGKAALTRILGLRGPEADDEVEALRSVAIGDDEANTIDLTEESGEWVVFGGGGDDMIMLGADTPPPADATPPAPDTEEAEEIVYRLVVNDTDSTITTPDGSDTISGFALGEDMLTFVVTSGTSPTPTPATNDAPEISAIDTLMAAFASVSLVFDNKGTSDATNMTYTGITFGVVAADSGATPQVEAANLSIAFAGGGLNQAGLIEALGATIMGAADLDTIFADRDVGGQMVTGKPTEAGTYALSDAGEMLIDTLFGNDESMKFIDVAASLPEELL